MEKSVEIWFNNSSYTEKTKRLYLKYMDSFCKFLKTNPDALAAITTEQTLTIQATLANAMKDAKCFQEYTVHLRLAALRAFWEANGVKLHPDIYKYPGASWLMKRERRWKQNIG